MIFNLLKPSKHAPRDRGMYAFTKYRRGEFILFIKESSYGVFDFMQLPDRYSLSLTQEEFAQGVASNLLDFVECLPEDVFEVAVANIFENKA